MLSIAESIHSSLRCHHNAQTCRTADGFLGGCDYNVDIPVIEPNLFAAYAADAINDDKSVRADSSDKFRESFDLGEHARAGIRVCDGDHLVLLLLQCLLHLIQLRSIANGSFELCRFHAVCFKAVREAISEVASMQD